MDSLDIVEAVMFTEEILGIDIPDGDAETFGSPREIVDWLEPHLLNRRPNKQAVAILRELAKIHDNPKLAEGLDGTWRREQITAIVRDIFSQ